VMRAIASPADRASVFLLQSEPFASMAERSKPKIARTVDCSSN
jgi:hypothetical protein